SPEVVRLGRVTDRVVVGPAPAADAVFEEAAVGGARGLAEGRLVDVALDVHEQARAGRIAGFDDGGGVVVLVIAAARWAIVGVGERLVVGERIAVRGGHRAESDFAEEVADVVDVHGGVDFGGGLIERPVRRGAIGLIAINRRAVFDGDRVGAAIAGG